MATTNPSDEHGARLQAEDPFVSPPATQEIVAELMGMAGMLAAVNTRFRELVAMDPEDKRIPLDFRDGYYEQTETALRSAADYLFDFAVFATARYQSDRPLIPVVGEPEPHDWADEEEDDEGDSGGDDDSEHDPEPSGQPAMAFW